MLIINALYLFAIDCSNLNNITEYNGHYYITTTEKTTFTEAKLFAEQQGGYLAIPNDEEENNFLKNLIGGNNEAWIGIWDSNLIDNYCYSESDCAFDDERFYDIKGDDLFYTNWDTNEPDNLVKAYDTVDGKAMVSPLGEHWVVLNGSNGKWSDVGNHKEDFNNPYKAYALIEFDNLSECLPPQDDADSDIDLSTPHCNTQIYDDRLDTLQQGQTFECQQDKYNTWYCPEALAPADEYWDYEDGYSVANSGVIEADIECPSGYEYNSETQECERIVICY